MSDTLFSQECASPDCSCLHKQHHRKETVGIFNIIVLVHADVMALLAARMMKDPIWLAQLTSCPTLVPTGCCLNRDKLGERMCNLVVRLAGDDLLSQHNVEALQLLSELIYVRPKQQKEPCFLQLLAPLCNALVVS